MFVNCKIIGHSFHPYRYTWVEFIPTKRDSQYNREGSWILSHVFCTRCGEIREVVNVGGKRVRYVPVSE